MDAQKEWPKILDFAGGSTITEELVNQRYRKLSKKYHPDFGGSNEDMTQLNLSRDLALRWIEKERRRKAEAEAARQASEQAARFYQNAYQQQAYSQSPYANDMAFFNSMMGNACAQNAHDVADTVEETKGVRRKSKREKFRNVVSSVRSLFE